MKKFSVLKILTAVFAVSVMAVSAVLAEDNITVKVNGNKVNFDVQPFYESDRVMVPVRGISEALGLDVEWDEMNQKVTVSQDNKKVAAMVIGSKYIKDRFCRISETDVAPMTKNFRTFLPLRSLSELLGCSVGWDDKTQTVDVNSVKTTLGHKSVFDIPMSEKPLSVLNGQFSVCMPEGAVRKAAMHETEFAEADESVSSLSVTCGEETVSVTFENLYKTSSGDIKADVKNLYNVDCTEVKQIDGAEMAVIPGTVLDNCLIKDKDGMLTRVYIGASETARQSPKYIVELAGKIMSTVKYTGKAQSYNARKATLAAGLKEFYTADIPEGYAVIPYYASENVYWEIRKVTPSSEKTDFYCEIYLDKNGTFNKNYAALSEDNEIPAVIYDIETNWRFGDDDLMLAKVTLGINKDLYVKAYCTTDEERKTVTQIAESIE